MTFAKTVALPLRYFIASLLFLGSQCLAQTTLPSEICSGIEIIPNSIPQGALAFSARTTTNYAICVYSAKDQTIRSVFAARKVTEYPSWSPDGKWLAFHSEIDRNREIYKIQKDGTGLTRLTFDKGLDEDPTWTPDGKKIVFSSGRLAHKSQNIFWMNNDGTNIEPLTKLSSVNSVPRVSPDGNQILFSTNEHWPGWDIMLLDLAKSSTTQLSSGITTYCRANWSPDGQSFVYSHGSGKNIDLYLRKTGENSELKLTEIEGREYDATWGENKDAIFFVSESKPGKDDFQIKRLDLTNKQIVPVSKAPGITIRYLSWTKEAD